MAKAPLNFTFYIAAPVEKVWDGFVSKEANHKIFVGADFEVDLKPGGAMIWSGPGKNGKPIRYVTGEVLRVEVPKLFEYRFGMGDGAVMSRVTIALTPESEAVKVVVTNDQFADDDPAYTTRRTLASRAATSRLSVASMFARFDVMGSATDRGTEGIAA